MKLPLAVRIKKKSHQDIAAVQDMLIEECYQFFPRAVFYGGTAIWRCYNGNRFSEDIDMYLPTKNAVHNFFEQLKKRGFIIHKQKISENSLYSLVELNRVQVRFEALFLHKKNAILKEYELLDGSYMSVYTLTADDLLQEKIAACIKRAKVRDLYDIFFLLRHISGKRAKELDLIQEVKISDAENLSAIILSGPIPTVQELKEAIARWGK